MQLLVNIDVDDLERAVAFYTRALGLREGRRLFGGSVVELLGASSAINLLRKSPGGTAVPGAAFSEARMVRDYHRHWTPVHLDIVVDDIEAAVTRARDAGAKVEADIESFPWGSLALMSDPFGHGFCFVQFSAAGYEAVTGA